MQSMAAIQDLRQERSGNEATHNLLKLQGGHCGRKSARGHALSHSVLQAPEAGQGLGTRLGLPYTFLIQFCKGYAQPRNNEYTNII